MMSVSAPSRMITTSLTKPIPGELLAGLYHDSGIPIR